MRSPSFPRVTALLLGALSSFVACGKPAPSQPDASLGLEHHIGLATTHTATCSDACGEAANPPLGGPHCGTVSSCRVFTDPVPRCEWLHNLEHGHVVLAYSCDGGCPEVVSALEKVRSDANAAGNTRVLVTPDPLLPTRVAAMVWGWGWTGDAVNLDAIRAVMAEEDVDAPEAGISCPQ